MSLHYIPTVYCTDAGKASFRVVVNTHYSVLTPCVIPVLSNAFCNGFSGSVWVNQSQSQLIKIKLDSIAGKKNHITVPLAHHVGLHVICTSTEPFCLIHSGHFPSQMDTVSCHQHSFKRMTSIHFVASRHCQCEYLNYCLRQVC